MLWFCNARGKEKGGERKTLLRVCVLYCTVAGLIKRPMYCRSTPHAPNRAHMISSLLPPSSSPTFLSIYLSIYLPTTTSHPPPPPPFSPKHPPLYPSPNPRTKAPAPPERPVPLPPPGHAVHPVRATDAVVTAVGARRHAVLAARAARPAAWRDPEVQRAGWLGWALGAPCALCGGRGRMVGWVGTRAGESVGIFGCGWGLGVIVVAPGGSCIGDGGWILWCGFFAVDAFLCSCVVFFWSAGVACFAHVVGGSCVGSMRTFLLTQLGRVWC